MDYRYLCVADELIEIKSSLARQACVYHIFHCQQRSLKFKASKMAIKYMINTTLNRVRQSICHILKK